MMEKMDKKTKNRYMEKEESNSNLQGLIELKKTKKEDESFQRTTLTHQMEKMKEEIFNIKKEINLWNRHAQAKQDIWQGKNKRKYYKRQDQSVKFKIKRNQE